MRSLGLDLSTKSGIALIDNGKLVAYELLKVPTKKYPDRKMQFKAFREGIIKSYEVHKPDVIVLEAVYSGPNPVITALLNQLRGIAIECAPEGTEVRTIVASKARKSILGKGNIKKPEVFKLMVKKFKLKDFKFSSHNDMTDAMLLALCGPIPIDNLT